MKSFNKIFQASVFVCFFATAMGALSPTVAHARSTLDLPYPVDQIWSSAVRFLRVDKRFPILEKDKDAGYILFDYVEEAAKVHKASLELVAVNESSGRAATRVVLNIPDKPRHVESLLLEKLGSKAKDDLGAPAPPPSRTKKEPPAEAKRPKDKDEADKAPSKREPEDDPNQPVRGDDGLPRLPVRKDFPRPSE
ncbi:MAG: hypothetical protein SF187_15455 [Deltaproteobacteria bacterium]|nr:hypothetical protein [Deltaproteobacteria bacterium]